MPIPKTPTPLQSGNFTMQANPDAIAGVQANETFLVTAHGENTLGNKGETQGFAKYQFNEQRLAQAHEEADLIDGRGLGRFRSGLANAMAAEEPSPDLIAQKREALIQALQPCLSADQQAGINGLDNDQLLASTEVVMGNEFARRVVLNDAIKGMTTISNLSASLYGGNPAPPDNALLARTVASSQVDQLLGTNCVAEETFGMDADGNHIGVSIQGDGAGITGKFRDQDGVKKDCLLDVDLSNGDIQRGLSDLEAVDYITGQIDRHCGNIFINPETKKVTGIDNDMAFPEISREAMFAAKGEFTDNAVAGMPKMMHQETAQKILAVSPEAMRATLTQMQTPEGISRLSPAAIDSACGRLAKLQNELKQPGGAIKVVAQFDENTYAEAMATQDQVVQAKMNMSINQAAEEDPAELSTVNKTSYIASAAIQAKRYEQGIKEEPHKFGRRPAGAAPPAPRNEEKAIYAAQLEQAKQTLMKNPASLGMIGGGQAQAQAQAVHKEIAGLKDKIAQYDKEIANLNNHKMGSMLRSLASGGSGNRKEFYADKKLDAQQQIGNLQRQLESIADKAMTSQFKADIAADARVAANRQQGAPPVAQNNAVQVPPVARQPSPALAGMVPNHPAPPPPGQFNHPPPSDMAPPVPDQDNLVQGNDQPKAAKVQIAAKDKKGDFTVQAAEDKLDVEAPDALDALDALDAEVSVEVAKKPSVAEMLKRTYSAPELGGHKQAQGKGVEEPNPADHSLRASGSWQSAKPSGPKPGGGSLSASHH
ncbi:MAG: hypothetical protein NTY98_20185 [Verrucomicrobia bacterium]|nr:hypothetical protein [Verrucomicrobiota bacterium]